MLDKVVSERGVTIYIGTFIACVFRNGQLVCVTANKVQISDCWE